MKPTKAMVVAARRADFDYYQRGRTLGAERFGGTLGSVIKVMLEVALRSPRRARHRTRLRRTVPAGMRRIVTASKPKPKRKR